MKIKNSLFLIALGCGWITPTLAAEVRNPIVIQNVTTTTTTAIVGDVKCGFQTVNHQGWAALDGSLLTGLSATQRTNATSLSFVSTLPDARNRFLIGAGVGRPSLTYGGSNTITIAQNNLPNVTLIGGNHSHSISDPGHNHSATVQFHDTTGGGFNGGRIQSTDRNPVRTQANASEIQIQSRTTGISIANSGNLSFPLNGGVTQVPIVSEPLSLSCNYFVYLGQ
jgi:hypothetical protein